MYATNIEAFERLVLKLAMLYVLGGCGAVLSATFCCSSVRLAVAYITLL